jgi:hypothetical protein
MRDEAARPAASSKSVVEMVSEQEADIRRVFSALYNDQIQLSRFQAQTIGSAVLSRRPGCRFLVFGLGHDTGLWLNLNRTGTTYFLETDTGWIDRTRVQYPELQVSLMPTFGLTVRSSISLRPKDLAAFPVIDELRGSRWDVILVDAPPGNGPTDPGRAVALFWAASLATAQTHVFVDDYERPLERRFTNRLIRDARPNAATIIPASREVPGRKLFWSIGAP